MKTCLVAILAALSLLAQSNKPFIQAELIKTIKAKSAKPGDPVSARTATAVALPGGVNIAQGTILLGQVRAASSTSLTISFDQAELGGDKKPLSLSIRAAMLPTGPQSSVAAQAGAVIGMPGVTLQVDDSPQHASKFESSGKDLQLNKGLQLMLAVPE
jgi:hypothetical protein